MAAGHAIDLVWGGTAPHDATGAVVFVHGRGADADGILELARHLDVSDFTWVAPQATHNTWYPFSFLAPIDRNEPWLTSALDVLGRTCRELAEKGFRADRVHWCGFSQGACLVSEYLARNARRYGGAIVFTGGLVGPAGTPRIYGGSFGGMPVFLGCGDNDPHVPLWRVEETASVFASMGANVTTRVYPGRPHTILPDEIEQARRLLHK
jgi:predicted esterase